MSEGKTTYYCISEVLEHAERIAQAKLDPPDCRKGDALIGILYNERDAVAVDVTSPRKYREFSEDYSAFLKDPVWHGFYICPLSAERASKLKPFDAPAKNPFDLNELADILGQAAEAERTRMAILPR